MTLVAAALAVLAAASCDDPNRYRDYDCSYYGGGRCRTVCDYWCDDWGCYPSCWDQCFGGGCYGPGMGSPPSASTSPSDGGASMSRSDAGLASDGGGVLCSACVANDDCANGALCILRGGSASPDASPPAGDASAPSPTATGFCSHPCNGAGDCPQGFTCTQLGSSKQCLPNAGSCP